MRMAPLKALINKAATYRCVSTGNPLPGSSIEYGFNGMRKGIHVQ
jgi:hypothetical protein